MLAMSYDIILKTGRGRRLILRCDEFKAFRMSIFRSTLRRLTSVRYLCVMRISAYPTSYASNLFSCPGRSPPSPPDDPGPNSFIACLAASCPTYVAMIVSSGDSGSNRFGGAGG
ncbi:hypothetical protein GJ496_007775 [Pomphorhynchus laevis]|nr:hypothetical protein GJ496_007775 [Pomphorhynchus laevis]